MTHLGGISDFLWLDLQRTSLGQFCDRAGGVGSESRFVKAREHVAASIGDG